MVKHKVGRNTPCPCGSGKKYKKCCGRSTSTIQSAFFPKTVDMPILRMYSLLIRSGLDVGEWRQQISQNIELEVFSQVPKTCLLSPDQAAPLLEALLVRLEQEMQRILSTDSKYFWLFLSRRLFIDPRQFQSSELTARLCWTIMNLAIFKYSLDVGRQFVAVSDPEALRRWALSERDDEIVEGESKFEGGTIAPIQLTLNDVKNVFLLEQLAHDYWRCTAALRRLYKGGELAVRNGVYDDVKHDGDTAWLIHLYDERLQYVNLLGDVGSAAPTRLNLGEPSEYDFWTALPNVWEVKIPLVWPTTTRFANDSSVTTERQYPPEMIPNYVWTPISLLQFYEKAKLFRELLTQVWMCSPEEFTTFLIAIGWREWQYLAEELSSRIHVMERGYSIDWREKMLGEVVGFYQAAYSTLYGGCPDERAAEVCRLLLQQLTYDEHASSSIDLWERTGRRPFIESEFGLIVDHSAFLDVLKAYFDPSKGMAGAIGELKGRQFEKEVAAYLELHAPGFKPWLVSRRIRRKGEKDVEIDVSGTCDTVLYIFECKCNYMNLAFDRGLPEELAKRRNYYNIALRKADAAAKFFANNPKGKAYQVPAGTKFIVSGAISPHPEYIHEKSALFFFQERIPRVCTPPEAASFISSFVPLGSLDQPWLIALN